MKVWANVVVKNEESFIWYALMSVVHYVDKILIYDTGSTDKSVEIIEEFARRFKDKVIFRKKGKVSVEEFTQIRQEMLDESDCDWVFILDGDEVWWDDSIRLVRKTIDKEGRKLDAIFVKCVLPVGDIYHFQAEDAGRYEIKGMRGHLGLRAINRKIPGLHVQLPFGQEGYFNIDGVSVQELDKVKFLDVAYMHLTHLRRSSVRRGDGKYKFELGKRLELKAGYPEVFYAKAPIDVGDIWQKRGIRYKLNALWQSPLKELKRRLVK